MNILKFVLLFFVLSTTLFGTEFTISSYNCGGLSNHYDYLRAACMEKLMQERYLAEPEQMSLNEKIQKVALKILFSSDPSEKAEAEQEWRKKGYSKVFKQITAAPSDKRSINKLWHEKCEGMITSYKVRPVVISENKVNLMLDEHLSDLCKNGNGEREEQLQEARKLMAKRIFANHLNHDIICLQEADYLEPSMFPEIYEQLFVESEHSKNGILWNKERFELVNPIGDILGRAIAVVLRDKESGKTVLIASGHITGCNPYRMVMNSETGLYDSEKGDNELQTIVDLFESQEADLRIIGMDSNVTAMHPRLYILRVAGYLLDYENFLDPTCTNPYQVLNTRIDWIALKSNLKRASITNIPVLSVGLNSIQTNISDHKPIAAKVNY